MLFSVRLARTAFWTLCACAYTMALWCTLVLVSDLRLLSFDPVIHDWLKEADFTSFLCLIASLAMGPFIVHFRRSRLYVCAGLGVWCFHLLWFFAFPVF